MNFQNVIIEKYRSLNELVAAIESRQENQVFYGRKDLASQERTMNVNNRFYGSARTYKQAAEMLESGYSEPLERMKKEVLKIDKADTQQVRRTRNHLVGGAVNVANALQGRPDSMIFREPRQEKTKTINLIYGFSALGNVSANELEKGGVNFVSLVNSLEKQGYRVKIDVIRCTTSNRTAIGYLCNVKEYAQRTNLLKLCFPLVHPSMLRRISFRWCETLPSLTDSEFGIGYGQSLIARLNFDSKAERAFLKEQGLLGPNTYYCNVYDAFQSKDIHTLAKKMDLVR